MPKNLISVAAKLGSFEDRQGLDTGNYWYVIRNAIRKVGDKHGEIKFHEALFFNRDKIISSIEDDIKNKFYNRENSHYKHVLKILKEK